MKVPDKKVLLVDDKVENLYLLETLLAGNGFSVDQAQNGEEALRLARKTHPDLIISDILMPVMDGFTLCHEIKGDNQLKDTAFVFYTASYLDQRDKELALNLGVDRYLVKPQEPEALLAVFDEVLEERATRSPKAESTSRIQEHEYLKEHNESLVRMLEKKVEQLDRSKRILEAEILVRREAEAKLQASLLEKEVLLKEIYHRTKNNMQVIIGLFDIQKRKAGHLSVEEVAREMSDRIYSMSMVHDLLFRSKNLYEIKLDQYLNDLTARLLAVYDSPDTEVEFELKADSIPVNLQFAVPLGLVITEILSNALKYAFHERSEGKISIEALFSKETGVTLNISDNGVGVDSLENLDTGATLGLYLIRTIVENQLFGGLEIKNKTGLSYSIRLPDLLLGR